jgi:hypothetical protein
MYHQLAPSTADASKGSRGSDRKPASTRIATKGVKIQRSTMMTAHSALPRLSQSKDEPSPKT